MGPSNKVGAQLHDSLGSASNLQKIFCAHIENYVYPDNVDYNRSKDNYLSCPSSRAGDADAGAGLAGVVARAVTGVVVGCVVGGACSDAVASTYTNNINFMDF